MIVKNAAIWAPECERISLAGMPKTCVVQVLSVEALSPGALFGAMR